MSSDRGRPLLARLVAALAFLLLPLLPLLTAGPALAAPSPGTASPGTASAGAGSAGAGPGRQIADALRASPVYVDPSYASAVPPARQQQLAAQIQRTGLPIKVALVPLVKGDAFDGDPDVLADIIHERLGQDRLVLITMDQWSDALDGHEWPDSRYQGQDAVDAVQFLPALQNAGLADRVAKAVQLIAQGDGTKVYQQATATLDRASSGSTPPAANSRGGQSGGIAGVVAGAVALVLLLLAAGLLVRRRRGRLRGSARTPFTFPQAVFAAHRAADEQELRRRAQAEVIALGETAQSADAERTPGLGRALDAYAAAGKALDDAHGMPDLAGVLALVLLGRDALDDRSDALPLCFFHPLHGRADRRVTWRPLGRREQLDVAVCADCAQAVRDHRAPEVLTATTADGHSVPYFELPAATSPWSATGYGSLATDLPARILRGDLNRGAERTD